MDASWFFGKRLRELRNSRNLSARQLAYHLKCSPSLIYNIEKGLNRPQPELIVLTAQFFGVTTDYLLVEEVIVSEARIVELYKNLNNKGKLYLMNLLIFLNAHE